MIKHSDEDVDKTSCTTLSNNAQDKSMQTTPKPSVYEKPPWKYCVEGGNIKPKGSPRLFLHPPPFHPGDQCSREPADNKTTHLRSSESTSSAPSSGSSRNNRWFPAHAVFDDADANVTPTDSDLCFESRFEGDSTQISPNGCICLRQCVGTYSFCFSKSPKDRIQIFHQKYHPGNAVKRRHARKYCMNERPLSRCHLFLLILRLLAVMLHVMRLYMHCKVQRAGAKHRVALLVQVSAKPCSVIFLRCSCYVGTSRLLLLKKNIAGHMMKSESQNSVCAMREMWLKDAEKKNDCLQENYLACQISCFCCN
jgi:hypothetical protein